VIVKIRCRQTCSPYRSSWLLPDGAAAHFVAEALNAVDAIPTKELSYCLITNPETKGAFAKHLPAEQSLLGRHIIKALKELGLRVEAAEWGGDEFSLEIVCKVKR
jgi:hypothetical protein